MDKKGTPAAPGVEPEIHEKFFGPYGEYYNNIARGFLAARAATGRSSAAMAELLGVEKSRYSRLETRKIVASTDNIIALIDQAGISPNTIFGYTQDDDDRDELAHDVISVLKALPMDSFDFIANVILHEVKTLKKPRVSAEQRLSVPEVFEILEDLRQESGEEPT